MATNQAPTLDSLQSLLATVQRNERSLKRFQDIELALMGAPDFGQFLEVMLNRLRHDFDLSGVRLMLAEVDDTLRDLIDTAEGIRALDAGLCIAQDAGTFSAVCGDGQLWIGAPRERHAPLFGPRAPASAVVMPLARNGRYLGIIALGSRDARRFSPEMATDFLERFGAVVAVCLENMWNRERLKRIGLTDPLTGLSNRRYFDQRLREEVVRGARYGAPLACLLIDIDHFKRVNDSHGHATGDRALRAASVCMRAQLRVTDTLARYGGEEFAALLVQTEQSWAGTVAERVRRAVARLEVPDDDGAPVPLTISIGLASVDPRDSHDPETLPMRLLGAADAALYTAKRSGRDRVVVASAATLR
ncbi:GGDEF domain-containing protein [Pandoraea horticolens]|uniref:GGDEF domain-containing protein n=1 Tax=Pandoraea horticolens TaxID=2508298 RepID=UPI001FE972A9|nr:sensor domain-containing diguanylate cyclase [Pandoraea horticolens]